jgi:ABC-2 type transport system ATP-binding protein
MILVDRLSKRYGAFEALSDLSLEVRSGETLALLGPNGAGKSTTIKAIVGLLRPSQGRVLIDGLDIWREPVKAKRRLGYVPDRPYLYGKLSGLELLRFSARTHGLPFRAAEERIEQLLDYFRLDRFASSLIETYSHGMRQKLTLALALLHEPAALILDEPMVGLDPLAACQLRELLRSYPRTDRTVLFATHQLALAEEVADRVALIHRGQLLALGQPQALLHQEGLKTLEEFFLRLTEESLEDASALP